VFLSFVCGCEVQYSTKVKAGDGGCGYLVCCAVMRSLASTKFYMDNVLMPSESLALFQEIGHEVWSLMSIPIIPYRPYYTFFLKINLQALRRHAC